MISTEQIVALAAISGSMVLAGNKLSGFGLSFETKAWMALAWALIITALVVICAHLGGPVGGG